MNSTQNEREANIETTVQTNALTSAMLYFSDPHWTNHPARFYRFRWP